MNRKYFHQVVLTAVTTGECLETTDIEEELRLKGGGLSFNFIEKKYLDSQGKSAADFFLSKDIQFDESKSWISSAVLNKDIVDLYQTLHSFFYTREYDFCIQTYNPITRKKRVIFSDMDSTLIENETLNDIAEKMGLGEKVATITQSGIEGKINFQQSMEKRLALLKGFPLNDAIVKVEKEIHYNPGVKTLMKTLNHMGVVSFLVTGGFDPIASQVKKNLNMHHVTCNRFESQNSLATGKWEGELVDGKKKLQVMESYLQKNGMIMEQSLAVGDGFNDIPMLKAAGLGIVYKGAMKVIAHIPHQINFTPLTTLLYYQGYKKENFIDE